MTKTELLLNELKETLRDLNEWDGTADALEIIKENIRAALAKHPEPKGGLADDLR